MKQRALWYVCDFLGWVLLYLGAFYNGQAGGGTWQGWGMFLVGAAIFSRTQQSK